MNRFPDVLKPPTRLGLIQSGQLSSRPKHPPVGASSNPGIPQRPSIQLQEVPFNKHLEQSSKIYKLAKWNQEYQEMGCYLWYGVGLVDRYLQFLNTMAKPTGNGTICSFESGKSRKYSPENKHSSPSKMMVGLLFIWNGLFLEGHVNFYPVLPSQDSYQPKSTVGKSRMNNHMEDP